MDDIEILQEMIVNLKAELKQSEKNCAVLHQEVLSLRRINRELQFELEMLSSEQFS